MAHFWDIGSWVRSWAHHPNLLIFVAGFFVGTFLLPVVWKFLIFRGAWEEFRARVSAAYRANSHPFWGVLTQAYGLWSLLDGGNVPDKLNGVIDQSRKSEGLLSGDPAQVSNSLKYCNATLWQFISDLTMDIEKSKGDRGYKPQYVQDKEDYKQFSMARKELADFWDREAERILFLKLPFVTKYWVDRIERTYGERRIWEMLAFLETELIRYHSRPKMGAPYLFYLASRSLGSVSRQTLES